MHLIPSRCQTWTVLLAMLVTVNSSRGAAKPAAVGFDSVRSTSGAPLARAAVTARASALGSRSNADRSENGSLDPIPGLDPRFGSLWRRSAS